MTAGAELPMEIADTPHWPLARARDARDAEARWLEGRTKGRHAADIKAIQFRTAPWPLPATKLWRSVCNDTRAVHHLRRLWIFARYVAAREAAAPPPANLSLSSLI